MPNALVTALQTLTAERRSLVERERDLIRSLNRVLAGIGYQVVARSASSASPRVTRKMVARGRRKPLTCPHCDRRFAQPVHLGRHVSAAHRAEKKAVQPKVVKRKASRKKASNPASAPPAKAPVATVRKAARKVKLPAMKAAAKPKAEKPTRAGTEAPAK